MSKPRVIIKANPKRNSQAALIEAMDRQTKAINQLVGMVGALLAEREEQAEEQPVARYMDGTPKG